MRTDIAKERVQQGMAFLDEKCPGWREAIDPSALEISHADCCILGQSLGEYAVGVHILFGFDITDLQGNEFTTLVQYGFTVAEDYEWDTLQNAWLAQFSEQEQRWHVQVDVKK